MTDHAELFKYFLDRAAQGVMINEIDARGLRAEYSRPTRTVRIGDAVAFLRVAHPFLDREMRGQELHFIHGLEHVRALKDGDRIANELQYRVRV